MKVKADQLRVGDVLLFGRKIVGITRAALDLNTRKVRVEVEQGGRRSVREWNKTTEMTVKRD